LRCGELLQLRWDNVDFTNRILVLGNLTPETLKNGDSRIVPMTPNVYDTLVGTKMRSKTEWVMENPETGRPYKNLAKGWVRITQRAGLAGIRIHDMRHPFASWSLQNGIDPITTQTLLGHRTASMTKRYAHLNKEALIAAIDHFARSTNSDTRATVFCANVAEEPVAQPVEQLTFNQ